MKFEEDGPAKAKLIDEMIRIVQEDAPWTWGYFPTSAAALHQWVHNGKPTQIIRNHIQYLRVDPGCGRRRSPSGTGDLVAGGADRAGAGRRRGARLPRYRRRERENAARTLAREAHAGRRSERGPIARIAGVIPAQAESTSVHLLLGPAFAGRHPQSCEC